MKFRKRRGKKFGALPDSEIVENGLYKQTKIFETRLQKAIHFYPNTALIFQRIFNDR